MLKILEEMFTSFCILALLCGVGISAWGIYLKSPEGIGVGTTIVTIAGTAYKDKDKNNKPSEPEEIKK